MDGSYLKALFVSESLLEDVIQHPLFAPFVGSRLLNYSTQMQHLVSVSDRTYVTEVPACIAFPHPSIAPVAHRVLLAWIGQIDFFI